MTSSKITEKKAALRRRIVESAFRIFSEKTIDAVNLTEVAKAAGVGVATVYRYFDSKTALVLEVGTWVWRQYVQQERPTVSADGRSAAELFDYFLDAFIDLYRNHRDILRFNQFFNVYVQREDVTAGQMQPYNRLADDLAARFHECYARAMEDHTLRTDISEGAMFSRTLHLMLAVVTRYAVGLVYDAGFDPEEELLFQKKLLMNEFTTVPASTPQTADIEAVRRTQHD